jgi:hypothetical protein
MNFNGVEVEFCPCGGATLLGWMADHLRFLVQCMGTGCDTATADPDPDVAVAKWNAAIDEMRATKLGGGQP